MLKFVASFDQFPWLLLSVWARQLLGEAGNLSCRSCELYYAGTGSGVGTFVLDLLQDAYPDVYRCVVCVCVRVCVWRVPIVTLRILGG